MAVFGFSFFGRSNPSVVIRQGEWRAFMADSIVDLEGRRGNIQEQIAQLADMRSGSITGTGGRCGYANCHCHGAGDPGHGPYYRLTRKRDGKTVTETFFSAGRPRQSATRSGGISSLPRTERPAIGGQRADLRAAASGARNAQLSGKKRRKRSARKSRAK